jgi:hypothetical protein
MTRVLVTLLAGAIVVAAAGATARTAVVNQAARHAPLDRLLDTYVRGGLVYYRALKSDRVALDRYVQALDVPAAELARWPEMEQKAFWINAYNALVLRTVIDAYPIRAVVTTYPRNSIRQIPGAFERRTHRVAGESLTLDSVETRMLATFNDPRIVLALGRGARGGGRLRSEAYRADVIETQLAEAAKECAERVACFAIDRARGAVTISPLFGWRSEAFERALGSGQDGRWPQRSPIERAVLGLVSPNLFPSERAFLDQNQFKVEYGEFDWSLNEL